MAGKRELSLAQPRRHDREMEGLGIHSSRGTLQGKAWPLAHLLGVSACTQWDGCELLARPGCLGI